jgi:hypothetical protein
MHHHWNHSNCRIALGSSTISIPSSLWAGGLGGEGARLDLKVDWLACQRRAPSLPQ